MATKTMDRPMQARSSKERLLLNMKRRLKERKNENHPERSIDIANTETDQHVHALPRSVYDEILNPAARNFPAIPLSVLFSHSFNCCPPRCNPQGGSQASSTLLISPLPSTSLLALVKTKNLKQSLPLTATNVPPTTVSQSDRQISFHQPSPFHSLMQSLTHSSSPPKPKESTLRYSQHVWFFISITQRSHKHARTRIHTHSHTRKHAETKIHAPKTPQRGSERVRSTICSTAHLRKRHDARKHALLHTTSQSRPYFLSNQSTRQDIAGSTHRHSDHSLSFSFSFFLPPSPSLPRSLSSQSGRQAANKSNVNCWSVSRQRSHAVRGSKSQMVVCLSVSLSASKPLTESIAALPKSLPHFHLHASAESQRLQHRVRLPPRVCLWRTEWEVQPKGSVQSRRNEGVSTREGGQRFY
mmetsp:Transcript_52915/g.103481  ORF Transcript_52915/g.103481 Transcript_52915/m.103481 type:complete len:413 (+) Transcript_52915:238-1476(+)